MGCPALRGPGELAACACAPVLGRDLDGTQLGVDAYLHNHWVETYKSVCDSEQAAKALSASAAAFPTVMGRSTNVYAKHPDCPDD
eukprot:COSAG03_NODE_3950_length_1746_cov_255.909532_2_plen_85_part_00